MSGSLMRLRSARARTHVNLKMRPSHLMKRIRKEGRLLLTNEGGNFVIRVAPLPFSLHTYPIRSDHASHTVASASWTTSRSREKRKDYCFVL